MSVKRYTKEHEWVSQDNNIGTIGITNHAQESLGDIVFIELPTVGKQIKAGEQIGVIESVKAASELYTPVSGKIVEINNDLNESPNLINSSPEDKGWYMKVELNDDLEIKDLMTLDKYNEITK